MRERFLILTSGAQGNYCLLHNEYSIIPFIGLTIALVNAYSALLTLSAFGYNPG